MPWLDFVNPSIAAWGHGNETPRVHRSSWKYSGMTARRGGSANKTALWHAGNADEEEVYLSVLKKALRSWLCFSKNKSRAKGGSPSTDVINQRQDNIRPAQQASQTA
jgi:hypothetical protein